MRAIKPDPDSANENRYYCVGLIGDGVLRVRNIIRDSLAAGPFAGMVPYQTMMNYALRAHLSESAQPVTEKALRQILRQEMPEYLRGLTPRVATTSRKRTAR